jgi:peroxiredoxin
MKVPYTNFKTFVNKEWKEIDTEEIFSGKKIIVFAIDGAFTSSLNDKNIQEYDKAYTQLKSTGIDEVYCVSVNDTFVMNAWSDQLSIKNVKPLGDGEGVFTQGMGMLVNKPKQGFGMRSWRYSALIENGEVVKIFEESGKNNASDDDDPLEVSDVNTIIKYLKGE